MKTIALAGKGGTGKTTLSALLIRALLRSGVRPVLAIDADPATNLHLALGLPQPATVGDVREEMLEAAQAQQLGVAITRHEYLRQEVRMALEEGEAVDLLAMGRPEGQGCYCAVNHPLRLVVDELGGSYAYVVIDNEAGMEHLSRRTTRNVQHMLVVSDATQRGLTAAARIAALRNELDIASFTGNNFMVDVPANVAGRGSGIAFGFIARIRPSALTSSSRPSRRWARRCLSCPGSGRYIRPSSLGASVP